MQNYIIAYHSSLQRLQLKDITADQPDVAAATHYHLLVGRVGAQQVEAGQHLLHCLENDYEVCFPDEGVKYESDADDYFYDRDIADDSDISESTDENDEDQEAKIKIEID